MCYIFVDGSVYLGVKNKNYIPTTQIEIAKKFETEKIANNVLKSSVPKILRKNYNWKVTELEETTVEDIPEEINQTVVSQDEFINPQYVHIDTEEIKSAISDLAGKFSTLKGNKQWLLDEESNIDKQISDILHFIEFERFSASEGYKLCKALKELRLKRRDVKNELELINIINVHTCNNIANGNTSKAIDGLNNKKYAPRVLSELFESRGIDSICKTNTN